MSTPSSRKTVDERIGLAFVDESAAPQTVHKVVDRWRILHKDPTVRESARFAQQPRSLD